MAVTEQVRADITGVDEELASNRKRKHRGLLVGLAGAAVAGLIGGGLAGRALTQLQDNHKIEAAKGLAGDYETRADLAIRLGNMGITGVIGFDENSKGQTLVEITTDSGVIHAPEFDFLVVDEPNHALVIEDGLKETTTNTAVGKPFIVDSAATESQALASLEGKG